MPPARQRPGLEADHDHVVTIERRAPEQPKLTGVVCRAGSAWALVHVEDSFALDGWKCIRVADVRAVRRGVSERFADEVLRRERWFAGADHPELPLDDTAALLKSLSARPFVALSCEGEDDFLFGRLLRVGVRSAVLHHVGTEGVWFHRATRIALADVTLVEFGSRYCVMFERHAQPWQAPSGVKPRLATLQARR